MLLSTTPVSTEDPPIAPQETSSPPFYARWWLHLMLMLVLFVTALIPRWHFGQGDLWLDEADYTIASLFGFDTNRTDNEMAPDLPEKLVVLRHYHAPMTAYLLTLGRWWGHADQQIRFPFMVVGGLVCCLTYLCGLRLFRRRDIAFFCGLVVALTPMQVRAGSHALPWAMITLTLLGLTWTLQSYVATRHPAWLTACCGVLGMQFVSSEIFYPTLVALAVAAPVVVWPEISTPEERNRLLAGVSFGLLLFFTVIFVLWPAGLTQGNSWRNLMHYADLAAQYQAPARIGGVTYTPAPKWAYLYWYATLYTPYFVLYAAGALASLVLLLARRLSREAGVVWAIGGVITAVAHRANMFGPEYLAHCLPFFTLLGGLAFLPLLEISQDSENATTRTLGTLAMWGVMAAAVIVFVRFEWRWQTTEIHRRQTYSRWPTAAKFLMQHWRPEEGILIGPQDPSAPRWYLYREVGWPVMATRILPLPLEAVDPDFQKHFSTGHYTFAILSSTFMPPPYFASPLKAEIARSWQRIYESSEPEAGRSRLLIYQRVNFKKPFAKKAMQNVEQKSAKQKATRPKATGGNR